MKTVFKEGMIVYDQINFPDMEGKVYEIDLDSLYPISVSFGVQEYEGFYSLEGKERNSFIPTLSTKPYEVELKGFEQKGGIPTFEDIWDNKEEVYTSPDYDENYSGYPSEELADAAEALRKLLFLRDYYNERWQPDWEDDKWKYYIENYRGKLDTDRIKSTSVVLSFRTKEIRDKFLEEQKELLELAKPLL